MHQHHAINPPLRVKPAAGSTLFMIFTRLAAVSVLTGCAGGLPGAPAASESPVGAADLALTKAAGAAARESNGAHCFRDAVLRGAVERLPLQPASSARRVSEAQVVSAEQARLRMAAADALVVPVYCRNAEPKGIAPSKSATAKLRDTMRWLDAEAVVLGTTTVESLVRATGGAHYRQVDVHDTGLRQQIRTNNYIYTVPLLWSSVRAIPQAGTVDVPGSYTEAWALVRVPRDTGRAYREACAAIGANSQPSFEKQRTCALYSSGGSALRTGTPPLVPLNPEEYAW